MLINIKYLVITIISIFLALSIGIFMGAQLDSQSFVLRQQEALITKIQEQFDELNRANTTMQEEIKGLKDLNTLNDAYIKNVFPDYVRGKLADTDVAVIRTTEDYAFSGVEGVLQMAGAHIPAVITVTDRVMEAGDEELNQMNSYFGEAKSQDAGSIISQKVAEALVSGKTQDLEYLQQMGYIDVAGDFSGPPGYVVICGGNEAKTVKGDIVDVPLIKKLKALKLTVVGVETSGTANSYMELYKRQKISTIDNVDTTIGQTSLVLVLRGKQGHFGIKPTAQSLMPVLNEGAKL